jgi:hypothetical protein
MGGALSGKKYPPFPPTSAMGETLVSPHPPPPPPLLSLAATCHATPTAARFLLVHAWTGGGEGRPSMARFQASWFSPAAGTSGSTRRPHRKEVVVQSFDGAVWMVVADGVLLQAGTACSARRPLPPSTHDGGSGGGTWWAMAAMVLQHGGGNFTSPSRPDRAQP